MITNGKMVLLASLLIPGMAAAQINLGDTAGVTEEAIRSTLEAQGYVISEIEMEEDEFEVEAELDGKAYEIEISSDTGQVIGLELEDDEDDD